MLRGFLCPNDRRVEINFANPIESPCFTTCQTKCFPSPFLYAIILSIKKGQTDANYYRASNIASPCAYKCWLQYNKDYYTYPARFVYAIWGTAFHRIMEDWPKGIKEMGYSKKIEVDGKTYKITATIDYEDKNIIADYKTSKSLAGSLPKGEHKTQINVYKWIRDSKKKLYLIYGGRLDCDCKCVEVSPIPEFEEVLKGKVREMSNPQPRPCYLCELPKKYCDVINLCPHWTKTTEAL